MCWSLISISLLADVPTSDDVVYTVVPTSPDPAITKEPPIRPTAVPLIDCYARASMVRYRFRHKSSVLI